MSHERYRAVDSVDPLWFSLLSAAGFAVQPDESCFVAYDGKGTLSLATKKDLDPDDTVAALLLHELCHHAVRGDAGREHADWGLEFAEVADLRDEYAALRLQRWLAEEFGLGDVLHPTTEHRAYYDALDGVGFTDLCDGMRFAANEADVLSMAATGRHWLRRQAWWPELQRTLQRTAVAAGVRQTTAPEAQGCSAGEASLFAPVFDIFAAVCVWLRRRTTGAEQRQLGALECQKTKKKKKKQQKCSP